MSSNLDVGFVDGACHSTYNLCSTAWALFAPDSDLVNLQGIFLGHTTNNISKYSVVIELLLEAVAKDSSKNDAIYGYHPPSITSSLREISKVQAMEDHIKHQHQVLQL